MKRLLRRFAAAALLAMHTVPQAASFVDDSGRTLVLIRVGRRRARSGERVSRGHGLSPDG